MLISEKEVLSSSIYRILIDIHQCVEGCKRVAYNVHKPTLFRLIIQQHTDLQERNILATFIIYTLVILCQGRGVPHLMGSLNLIHKTFEKYQTLTYCRHDLARNT